MLLLRFFPRFHEARREKVAGGSYCEEMYQILQAKSQTLGVEDFLRRISGAILLAIDLSWDQRPPAEPKRVRPRIPVEECAACTASPSGVCAVPVVT